MLADADQPVRHIISIFCPVPQGIQNFPQFSARCIGILCSIPQGVRYGCHMSGHIIRIGFLLAVASCRFLYPAHTVIEEGNAVTGIIRSSLNLPNAVIFISRLSPIRIYYLLQPASRQVTVFSCPACPVCYRGKLPKNIIRIPGGIAFDICLFCKFPGGIITITPPVSHRIRDAAYSAAVPVITIQCLSSGRVCDRHNTV